MARHDRGRQAGRGRGASTPLVKNVDADGTVLIRTWSLHRGDAFAAVHLARGPWRVLANPEPEGEKSGRDVGVRTPPASALGPGGGWIGWAQWRGGSAVYSRPVRLPAVRAQTRGAQALSHRSGVFVDPTEDRIGRK